MVSDDLVTRKELWLSAVMLPEKRFTLREQLRGSVLYIVRFETEVCSHEG